MIVIEKDMDQRAGPSIALCDGGCMDKRKGAKPAGGGGGTH